MSIYLCVCEQTNCLKTFKNVAQIFFDFNVMQQSIVRSLVIFQFLAWFYGMSTLLGLISAKTKLFVAIT